MSEKTEHIAIKVSPVVLHQRKHRMEAEAEIIENNDCVSLSVPACVDICRLNLLPNSEILHKQYFHIYENAFLNRTLIFSKNFLLGLDYRIISIWEQTFG